jgi:hypothetical protein
MMRGARALRSLPSAAGRSQERRAARGHHDEPERVPLGQGQRGDVLRDPSRLEEGSLSVQYLGEKEDRPTVDGAHLLLLAHLPDLRGIVPVSLHGLTNLLHELFPHFRFLAFQLYRKTRARRWLTATAF